MAEWTPEQIKKVVDAASGVEAKAGNAAAARDDAAAAMTGAEGAVKGIFGGDSAKFLSSMGDIGSGIEANLIKQFKGAGAAAGLAGTAVLEFGKAVASLAVDLANAEANFMKATGASKDFARSMTMSYVETRKFGASVEETSEAMGNLYSTFTDFTFLNSDTQEELTMTTTLLTKLGVESGVVAKNIQISTKALGMTGVQAAQTQLDLAKFAEELGVPIGKMGEDFANNGNMLAKMGDQGVEAFKDLAIASKVTGMEMSKILAITDKFDTFEGAAEMAGKLNAAIGGNFVNAMDLMMATDPNERFQMIRDSILDAGLSFDDMSYYQKKFYTESLGLSDVGDLALALKGDMDMVDESVGRTSQSYEEAAARAKEMQTLQENLNIVFQNLIPVVTPLVDIMVDFTGWLAENHEMVRKVIGALTILGGIILGIAALAGLLASPFLAFAAAIGLVIAGIMMLSDMFFNRDVGASTFLEGTEKLAHAFETISKFMPKVTAQETTSAVTGMAAAGAAAGATGGGGERPYEVTINLQVDKKNIASVVKELNGGFARDAIAGRA